MGRVPREYSSTGCYHIMLRGNERKKIFLDEGDHQRFLETLLKKKKETELAVYAYCLMGNHVHLVLQDDKNEISTIMKGIATSYAIYFNSKYNRVGHVFQDRFKSESVEDERYLMAVVRYVHNNPVQAEMVEKPDQYEWSSYRNYLHPENSELVDAQNILGSIAGDLDGAIQEFKRFSAQPDEVEFLDESDKAIKSLDEGRTYLDDFKAKQWPGLTLEDILADKKKRYEVIKYLRNNTDLSIRKIAELLKLHRRVVERMVTK